MKKIFFSVILQLNSRTKNIINTQSIIQWGFRIRIRERKKAKTRIFREQFSDTIFNSVLCVL